MGTDIVTHGDTMKTKVKNSAKLNAKSRAVRVSSPERIRLIFLVLKERKYIKALAALENKTISDLLLDPQRKRMPKSSCSSQDSERVYIPKETARVLRDSEKG